MLEADCPSGIVAEAILVIEIDEVLEARIVSDGSSAASVRNIACLRGRDSETACVCGT